MPSTTSGFFTYKTNDNLATLRIVTYSLFFLLLLLSISFAWTRSLKKQVDLKTADLIRSEAKFRVIFQYASEGIAIVYNRKNYFCQPKS